MSASTKHPGAWTRRRIGFLIGVAVGLLLVGTLLPIVLPRPSPVTLAVFERIEQGMTRAEVEGVLGGPPGDYRTRPTSRVWISLGEGGSMVAMGFRSRETWEGDEGSIEVTFDGGIVEATDFTEMTPQPMAVWDLICWRLDRAWCRLRGNSK
jgi:hypothetical protein